MKKNRYSLIREWLLNISLINVVISSVSLYFISSENGLVFKVLLLYIIKSVLDYLNLLFLWQDKRDSYSKQYKSTGFLSWSFFYIVNIIISVLSVLKVIHLKYILISLLLLIIYFFLSRYRHNMCMNEDGWRDLYSTDNQSIHMLRVFDFLMNIILIFIKPSFFFIMISIVFRISFFMYYWNILAKYQKNFLQKNIFKQSFLIFFAWYLWLFLL